RTSRRRSPDSVRSPRAVDEGRHLAGTERLRRVASCPISKCGQNTDRNTKGLRSRLRKPLFSWLRGLDLNQRPLGYEHERGRDNSLLRPPNSMKLLTGTSAHSPHCGSSPNQFTDNTRTGAIQPLAILQPPLRSSA